MDAVLNLDFDIKKAILSKEAVVAVLLDFEKGHDMLWKEGLLIACYDPGFRCRMFNWIKNILCNQMIKAKVGSELPEELEIDDGTPQGSVSNPTLFNIQVNSMFSRVGRGLVFCCLQIMVPSGNG